MMDFTAKKIIRRKKEKLDEKNIKSSEKNRNKTRNETENWKIWGEANTKA